MHDFSALAATTKKTPSLYHYLALHLLLAMEVFSEEAIQGAKAFEELGYSSLRPQHEHAVKPFVVAMMCLCVSQQAERSLNVTVYYHLSLNIP